MTAARGLSPRHRERCELGPGPRRPAADTERDAGAAAAPSGPRRPTGAHTTSTPSAPRRAARNALTDGGKEEWRAGRGSRAGRTRHGWARRHAATARRSASRQLNEATCEGAPSGTAPRGEREGPTPLGRDPRRRENGTRALRPGLATRSSPAANSGRHSSRPAAPRGRPRPPPACGGGRAARGGGKRLPPQRGRLTEGHSCTN